MVLPVWLIPALEAATAGAGLLAAGSDSSTTTSTSKVTPASWNEVGYGSEDLWNEFIGTMSGVSSGGAAATQTDALRDDLSPEDLARAKAIQQDILYYEGYGGKYESTVQNLREHLKPYLSSNATETGSSSVKGMMAEDTGYQKDLADQYLLDMGVISEDQVSGIDTETSGYRDKIGQITDDASRPMFNFKFGGTTTPHISKRQLMTAGTMGDLADKDYGAAMDAINSIAAIKGNQKGLELNTASEFTPNKAELDYFNNVLKPIVENMQGLRFQTPSGSQTTTSEDSLVDRLSAGIATGVELSDVINQIFKKDDKEESITGNDIWNLDLNLGE